MERPLSLCLQMKRVEEIRKINYTELYDKENNHVYYVNFLNMCYPENNMLEVLICNNVTHQDSMTCRDVYQYQKFLGFTIYKYIYKNPPLDCHCKRAIWGGLQFPLALAWGEGRGLSSYPGYQSMYQKFMFLLGIK